MAAAHGLARPNIKREYHAEMGTPSSVQLSIMMTVSVVITSILASL